MRPVMGQCPTVWLIDYSDFQSQDLHVISSLLPVHEQTVLKDLTERAVQIQRAVTDLSLRYMLSAHSDVFFQDWQFERTYYGKPHIVFPHQSPIQFNVSHSGNCVAICLTMESKVGIDIEPVTRAEALGGLVSEFLSEKEIHSLSEVPEGERAKLLLRHWTLKEAVSKAVGVGLHLPFEKLTLEVWRRAVPTIDSGEVAEAWGLSDHQWSLQTFEPVRDFFMAIAIEKKGNRHLLNINFNKLSYQEVLRQCSMRSSKCRIQNPL